MKKDCFKKKNDEKDQGNQASDSKKKNKKKTKKDKEEEDKEAEIVLMATDFVFEEVAFVAADSIPEAAPGEAIPETARSIRLLEEQDEEDEMRVFLRKVALLTKKSSAKNMESWIDAVQTKLNVINIQAVSRICHGILTINKKMKQKGYSKFHSRTIEIMAEEAINDVETRWDVAEDYINELFEDMEIARELIKELKNDIVALKLEVLTRASITQERRRLGT
jgi:hypothetical protein